MGAFTSLFAFALLESFISILYTNRGITYIPHYHSSYFLVYNNSCLNIQVTLI